MTETPAAWVDEAEDWDAAEWAFTVPRRVRLRLWITQDIDRLRKVAWWSSRKA